MKLLPEIMEIAEQHGISKVGVASIDRFEHAPKENSPLNLLPNAKSVISLGIRMIRGAVEANRQAYRQKFRPALYTYMVFGYTHPNSILENAAYNIALSIEKGGHIAVPVPASRPADLVNLRGTISHRHAAVAAGIADFGWNGLAITKETGSKIRFISIVTDAPLEPTALIKKRICEPDKCGYMCIKACPLKAFKQEKVISLKIGEKETSYYGLEKWSCILGSYGMRKEAMGVIDFQPPDNPDRSSFLQATSQAAKEGRESERAGSCGQCMVSCPLGD